MVYTPEDSNVRGGGGKLRIEDHGRVSCRRLPLVATPNTSLERTRDR